MASDDRARLSRAPDSANTGATLADMAKQAVRWGRDRLRDIAHTRGFDDAADVCVQVVQSKIDEIQGRMGNLTRQDQHLLAELSKLKAEMEAQLSEFVPSFREKPSPPA